MIGGLLTLTCMLLVLSDKGKGMQSSSEQPLVDSSVTTLITAAMRTARILNRDDIWQCSHPHLPWLFFFFIFHRFRSAKRQWITWIFLWKGPICLLQFRHDFFSLRAKLKTRIVGRTVALSGARTQFSYSFWFIFFKLLWLWAKLIKAKHCCISSPFIRAIHLILQPCGACIIYNYISKILVATNIPRLPPLWQLFVTWCFAVLFLVKQSHTICWIVLLK